MKREELEGRLIDYIDGLLDETEIAEIQSELESNQDARKLYEQLREVMGALDKSPAWEPTASLATKFDAALRSELDKPSQGRQVFLTPAVIRVAATVLLLIGAGVGYWVVQSNRQAREMVELREEMNATKRLMMAMLDNDQSASQRVKGATVAFNMEKTDDQIVIALVKAMNEDPNTNVRLAALEALGKFSQQAHVRSALLTAMATQKDPIVQIALIQLLVRMKEKGVVKDLENIVNDVQTMKAVKDEAYSGLLKLS